MFLHFSRNTSTLITNQGPSSLFRTQTNSVPISELGCNSTCMLLPIFPTSHLCALLLPKQVHVWRWRSFICTTLSLPSSGIFQLIACTFSQNFRNIRTTYVLIILANFSFQGPHYFKNKQLLKWKIDPIKRCL
jgi:hypothetical protein